MVVVVCGAARTVVGAAVVVVVDGAAGALVVVGAAVVDVVAGVVVSAAGSAPVLTIEAGGSSSETATRATMAPTTASTTTPIVVRRARPLENTAPRGYRERCALTPAMECRRWPRRRTGSDNTERVSDFYCDEVLSGRTRVAVEYEDDEVLAFQHTRPAYSDAHVVVIPRAHVDDLLAADPEALRHLLEVVRAQASVVVARHGACRVITNLGRYQDSKHLHWHIVSGDRM